ncbi:MAG: alanine racemase [Micrococcales bacterium]|nr:alanine racemase [Micrococcales bacterium]
MDQLTLSVHDKSVPPSLWGRAASEVAAERHAVDEFLTPIVTLDRAAEAHNIALLAAWTSDHDVELAPHGKTSMAPELWRHLLDAGATTLTVATPWQAMIAAEHGFRSLLLANELLDPIGIAWLRDRLEEDEGFEFACFLDSAEGLATLAATAGERPIDVLVEVGTRGGRAGVRDPDAGLALAWGAYREPRVRLVGVAGWEGPLGPDRGEESVDRVRRYLDDVARFARQVEENGFFEVERPIVSAGGSAWFDLVVEAFAPLPAHVRRVLRSGVFPFHDAAHYAGLSPLAGELRPALEVRARVLSRPSRRLAVLDAGRRDLPFDLGLPVPLSPDGSRMLGASITELNDQHAFLRLPEDSRLAVGEVVRLGVSHPCTLFDKWRLVPVLDDGAAREPVVVDFVRTLF